MLVMQIPKPVYANSDENGILVRKTNQGRCESAMCEPSLSVVYRGSVVAGGLRFCWWNAALHREYGAGDHPDDSGNSCTSLEERVVRLVIPAPHGRDAKLDFRCLRDRSL
jgi:hypothetical protein